MIAADVVELFVLKCASLKQAVDEVSPSKTTTWAVVDSDRAVNASVEQFSSEGRENAAVMAEHYQLFYMLENDIRLLIDDTLTEEHKGRDWWDKYAPDSAKLEHKANLLCEQEAGFTPRSDNPLDYITFGHLGDIIRPTTHFSAAS